MTEYQAHGGQMGYQTEICMRITQTHTHTHIRVYVNLKGVGRSCFFIHLFICSLTSQHLALLQEPHTLRITHFQVLFRALIRVVSQLAVNSSCPPVALSFCLKSSPSLSSLESTVCLLLLIESSVFVTLVTFGAFLIRLHDK